MRRWIAWWLSPRGAVTFWCCLFAGQLLGAIAAPADAQTVTGALPVTINLNTLLTTGVGALLAMAWHDIKRDVRELTAWARTIDVAKGAADVTHADHERRLGDLEKEEHYP